MPDKTPQNPFNLHASPENAPIRDKDNVETRLEPKYQRSAPNLAPTGNLGIKRDLPTNEQAKRFTIKKAGDLSKEFKSIAPKPQDKGLGWER